MFSSIDETWYWLKELHELLSSGPSARDDWVDIWIPLIAAGASLTVAAVSVYIASRSLKVARESEDSRKDSEKERRQVEQNWRIDDALVIVLQVMGRHFQALDEWLTKAEYVERNSIFDPRTGDFIYPPLPDLSELQAACYALRLHAKSERERRVTDALSHAITVLPNAEQKQRRLSLQLIMDAIRRWRSEGLLAERPAIETFERIEKDFKPR